MATRISDATLIASPSGTENVPVGVGTGKNIVTTLSIAQLGTGGSASGDLSGTYPGPTVNKIKGNTVPVNGVGALTNDGAGVLTWAPYQTALIFSTGLTNTAGTITVNSSQVLNKISNLTTNGFIKTNASDGTLLIDTATYLTGNQSITLSGDISGTGSTAITTAIGSGKVTNAMLAGGIDLTAKVTGTLPVANGGTGITSLGTGIATALGVNVGSAGAPVILGGALGTPSSGVLTNATGLPAASVVAGALANGMTATTQSANDNSTKVATTAYSDAAAAASGTSTPTASTIAKWDANKNLSAANFLQASTSTATAAGTTTLTVASNGTQYFTGTTTQTIILPVASTLVLNQTFIIYNLSTGTLTVNSSGSNLVQTIAAGGYALISCILTSGTTSASWNSVYFPATPLTTVGDLLVGGTVVNGVATPSRLAASTSGYPLISNGVGVAPTYQVLTSDMVLGATTNTSATAGYIGEVVSSAQSTYTNYTTTATYQNITSITLTPGDWDISAFFTYSSNSSTITAASNAIFVISTTTASASGATEGVNISYVPQAALLGTSKFSDGITPYRVSISGSTTYYLNSQATFTVGNPQFVGSIRARRIR